MIYLFTKHPRCMNETYLQHLAASLIFGGKMMLGGISLWIHALFPFLLQKTGSNYLFSMMQDYIGRSPVVEDRMHDLAQMILSKAKTN